MIKLSAVTKNFGDKAILRGANIEIGRGEFVALTGRSGSGKTTLLNIVGALLAPTSGSVVVGGVEITKATDSERAAFRNRKVGFVFQAFHVLPDRSAVENVMLPATLAGEHKKDSRRRAIENLDLVGLRDYADARPSAMSGGQLQRVAIARALMMSPEVILADEPTGNLDVETAIEIVSLFKKLRSIKNITIVAVTHEDTLENAADRIERIEGGMIVEAKR